ncbi:MAG: formylglycine-generating enzyme family protein [Chthoniobacterales bacterium]
MKSFPSYIIIIIALFFLSSSHFWAAEPSPSASIEGETPPLVKESVSTTNQPIAIELVTVGDAGNTADVTGYGGVNEDYTIGKYDVTASQYCAFLNAVAADDIYHLYHEKMGTDPAVASIQRSGVPTNYSYSIIHNEALDRGSLPITYVSYYSAMRFCNWLQNGQPTGAEGPETTETGAYTLNGTNVLVTVRENASWRLPTEDEWYKAAYYIGAGTNAGYWKYPTQENALPTTDTNSTNPGANYFYQSPQGITPNINFQLPEADEISISGFPAINHIFLTPAGAFAYAPGPYGTYDMGGNVFQWTSSRNSFLSSIDHQKETVRGGCWKLPSAYLMPAYSRMLLNPKDRSDYIGFRVIGPKPAPVLQPAPSSNDEATTLITEMLTTSAPAVIKNSMHAAASSATNGLTTTQKVAIIAALIAAIILACWACWLLWPLLPEATSVTEAVVKETISVDSAEEIFTKEIENDVADTFSDLFASDIKTDLPLDTDRLNNLRSVAYTLAFD